MCEKKDIPGSKMEEVPTRLTYEKMARFFPQTVQKMGLEISKSKNTFVNPVPTAKQLYKFS